MSSNSTIFAVDDVETARRVLEGCFSKDYGFESFETAETCLVRLQTRIPDLFLLDVELPGMDGYALCREIKKQPGLANTPVIFISARDDLESSMHGYDAGGIDFIVKPYKMAELQQKVELALSSSANKSSLMKQIEESETLTSLILSNLDEYALLIRFLRTVNGCANYRDVADALFAMLGSYKLDCALQIRLGTSEVTLGAKGENSPREVSVIRHVRTLGTLFEFKTRAAFNFPHVSVLVNNMPTHDPDLCGRLRDHLAIAVESADAKLESLQFRTNKERTIDGLSQMIVSVANAVTAFGRKYDTARCQGTILTESMLDELVRSFTHLGMSDVQEESILGIVRGKSFDLVELYDFGDETQATLSDLANQLSGMLENPVAKKEG